MRASHLATLITITASASLLVGCSHQEVTYTVNGQEVDPNPPTGADADVDPCSVLSDSTKQALGLAEIEPVEMPYTPDGGCQWDGGNPYQEPNLTLWVSGPEESSPTDRIIDVAGVPLNVWAIGGDAGRLIAYFDDLTLSLNYNKAVVEIDTLEALALGMTDALRGYGRA